MNTDAMNAFEQFGRISDKWIDDADAWLDAAAAAPAPRKKSGFGSFLSAHYGLTVAACVVLTAAVVWTALLILPRLVGGEGPVSPPAHGTAGNLTDTQTQDTQTLYSLTAVRTGDYGQCDFVFLSDINNFDPPIREAAAGDTVFVSLAMTDDGHSLGSVSVRAADGTEIPVTYGYGAYESHISFEMPAQDVTVTVTFIMTMWPDTVEPIPAPTYSLTAARPAANGSSVFFSLTDTVDDDVTYVREAPADSTVYVLIPAYSFRRIDACTVVAADGTVIPTMPGTVSGPYSGAFVCYSFTMPAQDVNVDVIFSDVSDDYKGDSALYDLTEEQVRNAVVSVCGDDTGETVLDPALGHLEVKLLRKDALEIDDAEILFSRLNQTFGGLLNTASINVYTSRNAVARVVSYTMDYVNRTISDTGDVGPGPYEPK